VTRGLQSTILKILNFDGLPWNSMKPEYFVIVAIWSWSGWGQSETKYFGDNNPKER